MTRYQIKPLQLLFGPQNVVFCTFPNVAAPPNANPTHFYYLIIWRHNFHIALPTLLQSGLFCALLHCRCIVWKVFKVFFDKTKESGYRSMKTEVFFLFVCFYARRDKLKIKKPSQNLDLYYLLLCHQKRGRMLGFLSLICSFNICISYVIDNVFRCVLTVESYTHLVRHSPHRSYSPSCFVWTE